MKKLIIIGMLLILAGLGMFLLYAFSLDHSIVASQGRKPLVPALPLLGPALMGLVMVVLGMLGLQHGAGDHG